MDSGDSTLRLMVAIAAIMCLASARRELDLNFGSANDRLHLAMEGSASVGWDFEVKSGGNVWFGDLQTIFGIASDTQVSVPLRSRRDVMRAAG